MRRRLIWIICLLLCLGSWPVYSDGSYSSEDLVVVSRQLWEELKRLIDEQEKDLKSLSEINERLKSELDGLNKKLQSQTSLFEDFKREIDELKILYEKQKSQTSLWRLIAIGVSGFALGGFVYAISNGF